MTRQATQILISGGGVAGLTAACTFGAAGYEVICVDPEAPAISETAAGADLRSTAFLQPAVALLAEVGLWERFAPHAAALQIMRIIDAGGPEPVARVVKDFDASDISDAPFGYNLPNWLLRRELLARMAELPNVTFCAGVATVGLLTRESEALVRLSDGRTIAAQLLIAADGRRSAMREALNIPVKTMTYGQKAIVFAVTHPVPHHNVSTEIHRSGGPFTLVPLPDRDGKPASAVVWMEHGAQAQRLAALPDADFEAEIMARSCGILGPLSLSTPRRVWPIISQLAKRMSGERVALMAEAAHVVPPIGAQGLNMSLGDLRVLRDLVVQAKDPGAASVLEAYHRARHREVEWRVSGIDLLNRASMVGAQGLRDLRAGALDMFYSIAPLRRSMMRAGLGLAAREGTAAAAPPAAQPARGFD